jgi:hypothetical protein
VTVLLGACGSSSAPEAKKEAPAVVPVSGLHALYQMYTASKAWAPDAQIYKLTSVPVDGVTLLPGKAAAWQVTLISPSLLQSRTYTFSVIDASASLPKGIDSGKPESWSGGQRSNHPFLIAAAKIDSDQAFEVASKKGAEYSAKNPGMKITYQLEQNSTYNNAAWRVIWGESAGSSSFSILVDASSGAYVETLR